MTRKGCAEADGQAVLDRALRAALGRLEPGGPDLDDLSEGLDAGELSRSP